MLDIVKYVFVFFSAIFPVTGIAQEKISFEDCLELAFQNNLEIKDAEYSEKIAAISHQSKKVALLPTINGNIGNNFSFGRGIDPYTNSFIDTKFKSYSGNIKSSVILFDGFANINSIKLAKHELDINKSTIHKIKNDITIDLASIYVTIIYLHEVIKANQEQIETSGKLLEMLNLKFNHGYIPESEVFKMRSQISNEELTLIENQNLLSVKYLELKQLLNLSIEDEIKIAPIELLDLEINTNENHSEIINRSIAINPLFEIAKLREEQYKTELSISRAGLWPKLEMGMYFGSAYSNSNIFYDFNQQIGNNKNYGINLSLSFPLFNGLETRYKIKESKLVYEQSLIKTEIEKNNLSKIVQQAINDANTSLLKLRSAEKAYEYAYKSFEADNLKFELGKININEFSITKNNYINAQAELIKAKHEHFYNAKLIDFYMNNYFSIK